MTIDAHFRQISPSLLNELKESEQIVKVFVYGGWNSDSDEWIKFRSSCTPEEFESFEKDADLIMAEYEANIDTYIYIQSRRNWHGLSFILTGYCREYELPFLVKQNPDGDKLPLVNAIFGGTKIGDTGFGIGYDAIRYLTPDEVKEVAEALSKISAESFEARYEKIFPSLTDDKIWEVAQEALSKMSLVETIEEKQNQLVTTIIERVFRNEFSPDADDYLELMSYYQEAAERKKAMLLYIG
ncbi:DUF1877 family protein [Argonema antarcticum]|uniref:DUF1877 family protein n=1 Tax=Argonema antarcticum TaxID=2942763 RepID=UPI002012AEA2|nr:DUF1877 family protein [Argonema antarcticum]MCL1472613.1 YfbM family protein [Argonema antarcticum A004/B2]